MKSFWLGAAAGMLVTAAAAFFLRARPSEGAESVRVLQRELDATRGELDRARAEAARPRAADALVDPPEVSSARIERASTAGAAPEAPRSAPEWERLLAQRDFRRAAELLSAAFEQGELTKLELMLLAVQHPELLIEGINAHGLPDAFRSVLIDTLSSLEDPLGAVSALDLAGEPNQRFSARIAAFLAQSIERGAAADARAVGAIEQLLAGNSMQGEKVNLYPVLAQLAALGDARALALLQDANPGPFAAGLRSLLDPPARDERGAALTGALVYSVQYNKGQWENRPRQLQSGDIVVSIGGERVSSAADFTRRLKEHHGLGPLDFVEAGVFRPSALVVGLFEHTVVQLDPGDLQLLYGVYTVKRP